MIDTYVSQHRQRFLDELFTLLRLPSISADPAYKDSVLATADAVADFLTKAGAQKVEVCPTPGYPVVYGEYLVDPSRPTVLVYGHYDVQPADPLNLWTTPAFEPDVRTTPIHPNGAIFARGACDDKGQVFMHIKAFEAMVALGNVPCNMKFMIEGEEEVGSNNLERFLVENRDRLACDVILISDTGIVAPGTPSVSVGLRGLSYVEVEVTGPSRDLHSGIYGGAVANPINILAEMIASLHDSDNRITIPGFYDRVQSLSAEQRADLNKAPFTLEEYKAALELRDIHGETGYTTVERTGIRPTLDVNGIWGGYTGEGAKTVIASKAFAKISMRLVPDQDPDEITELFTKHFLKIAPPSVRVKVKPHHGGHAYVCPTDHPGYRAAHKAMAETFGREPIPTRDGGSIPIVALFERELGVKSILMGFGLDSDAIHSPDEHYGLDNYFQGIRTIPRFYLHYAKEAKA